MAFSTLVQFVMLVLYFFHAPRWECSQPCITFMLVKPPQNGACYSASELSKMFVIPSEASELHLTLLPQDCSILSSSRHHRASPCASSTFSPSHVSQPAGFSLPPGHCFYPAVLASSNVCAPRCLPSRSRSPPNVFPPRGVLFRGPLPNRTTLARFCSPFATIGKSP